MSHTILFIQVTREKTSRTYSDFETVALAMEKVCNLYETHLKKTYPKTTSITYDIQQLFDFMDGLADLCCLVLDPQTGNYAPHNKDWIKEKIYLLLRHQANSKRH